MRECEVEAREWQRHVQVVEHRRTFIVRPIVAEQLLSREGVELQDAEKREFRVELLILIRFSIDGPKREYLHRNSRYRSFATCNAAGCYLTRIVGR